MEFMEKGGIVIVRLFPGEELQTSLKEVCFKLGGETYAVVSCIGQVKDVEIGYFISKGDYSPEIFPGPLELLNVSGIVSRDGEGYFPHLHAILGDRDKRCLGGHLIKATVSITAEIVLLSSPIRVRREYNPDLDARELRI
jgi:predicted DNA-binding protein with PD1-like motif